MEFQQKQYTYSIPIMVAEKMVLLEKHIIQLPKI